MATSSFNVATDQLVVLTNKLEKISRGAFPLAVRGTLNRAAFFTKKNTLQQEANKAFINRSKSFFRAFSAVDTAKGFEVQSMESTVGIKLGSGTAKQATKNMRKQERGGVIKGRSFIPIDTARTGKSHAKNVRRVYRTDRLNFRTKSIAQRSKEAFWASVRKEGEGGYLNYNGTVFFIRSIKPGRVKLVPLYSFKKKRSVKVDATHFVERSAKRTQKLMDRFYEKEAKRQIERVLAKK